MVELLVNASPGHTSSDWTPGIGQERLARQSTAFSHKPNLTQADRRLSSAQTSGLGGWEGQAGCAAGTGSKLLKHRLNSPQARLVHSNSISESVPFWKCPGEKVKARDTINSGDILASVGASLPAAHICRSWYLGHDHPV